MNMFYFLDELIIDWWIKNNGKSLRDEGVSLIDISNHLTEKSIVEGEFAKNFEEIMHRKMSFGEEYQKD
ncbi:hypothetical protein KAW18_02095 [candidate division WOR-3 bacterium]|nr:hypothetical protein [candidate division WOR-3 bacterium]